MRLLSYLALLLSVCAVITSASSRLGYGSTNKKPDNQVMELLEDLSQADKKQTLQAFEKNFAKKYPASKFPVLHQEKFANMLAHKLLANHDTISGLSREAQAVLTRILSIFTPDTASNDKARSKYPPYRCKKEDYEVWVTANLGSWNGGKGSASKSALSKIKEYKIHREDRTEETHGKDTTSSSRENEDKGSSDDSDSESESDESPASKSQGLPDQSEIIKSPTVIPEDEDNSVEELHDLAQNSDVEDSGDTLSNIEEGSPTNKGDSSFPSDFDGNKGSSKHNLKNIEMTSEGKTKDDKVNDQRPTRASKTHYIVSDSSSSSSSSSNSFGGQVTKPNDIMKHQNKVSSQQETDNLNLKQPPKSGRQKKVAFVELSDSSTEIIEKAPVPPLEEKQSRGTLSQEQLPPQLHRTESFRWLGPVPEGRPQKIQPPRVLEDNSYSDQDDYMSQEDDKQSPDSVHSSSSQNNDEEWPREYPDEEDSSQASSKDSIFENSGDDDSDASETLRASLTEEDHFRRRLEDSIQETEPKAQSTEEEYTPVARLLPEKSSNVRPSLKFHALRSFLRRQKRSSRSDSFIRKQEQDLKSQHFKHQRHSFPKFRKLQSFLKRQKESSRSGSFIRKQEEDLKYWLFKYQRRD